MRESEFYKLLDEILSLGVRGSLNLSNKDIDNKQAKELVKVLNENPLVKSVNLSNNRITNEVVDDLKNLVHVNELNINNNGIVLSSADQKEFNENGIVLSSAEQKELFETLTSDSIPFKDEPILKIKPEKSQTHFYGAAPPLVSDLTTNVRQCILSASFEMLCKKNVGSSLSFETYEHLAQNLAANPSFTHFYNNFGTIDWPNVSPKHIDEMICQISKRFKETKQELQEETKPKTFKAQLIIEQNMYKALLVQAISKNLDNLTRFKVKQLANITCALALFDIQKPDFMYKIASQVLNKIKRANPQSLIRILWGFSQLSIFHEGLFKTVAEILMDESFRLTKNHKAKILKIFTSSSFGCEDILKELRENHDFRRMKETSLKADFDTICSDSIDLNLSPPPKSYTPPPILSSLLKRSLSLSCHSLKETISLDSKIISQKPSKIISSLVTFRSIAKSENTEAIATFPRSHSTLP